MTARERLGLILSPELLAALEELVDERVGEAVSAISGGSDVPRWLTLNQAAERLSCSPDAVRMRAKRGRLESRHQGRRVYVSAASVDQIGRAK